MIVVRFIRLKSNGILSESQRVGRREGSGCPEVFVTIPYISLGLGRNRLSFTLSNLSPAFSDPYALLLSNIFSGFSGICVLLQSNPFLRFPQATALPLLWSPLWLLLGCLMFHFVIQFPLYVSLVKRKAIFPA